MKPQIFGACCLAIFTSGCTSGPKDFALSSVQLIEFADFPAPARYQLKVLFTTSTNLSRVRSGGYILASRGYFCDRPDDNALLMSGGLYFRDQAVSADVEIIDPIASGPLIYSTYVRIAREGGIPSKPPEISYDLRQSAEDVCFYVSGGNTSPFGFRSNTIRIPKQAITAALQSGSAASK